MAKIDKPCGGPVTLKRVVFGLLGAAVVLLVALGVVCALSMLFSAVGDTDAAQVTSYVAITLLVLLAVDLICLLLALAFDIASRSGDPPGAPPP
jgi:hypothetical protein